MYVHTHTHTHTHIHTYIHTYTHTYIRTTNKFLLHFVHMINTHIHTHKPGTGTGVPDVFKMILMGPEPILAAFRADLETAVEGAASVTKAMDRMLEVLPPGASKGTGRHFVLNASVTKAMDRMLEVLPHGASK